VSRLAQINSPNASIWTIREEDFHVQHVFHAQIAGIQGIACDFSSRIDPAHTLTDDPGCHPKCSNITAKQ
jgi:hypothetical protein